MAIVVDTDRVVLVLNGTNYYNMDYILKVTDRQEKPGSSMSPPGQNYKNNIIMALGGQMADIEVSFVIANGGDDKSVDESGNNTHPSGDTVVTVKEQIQYLKDVMQSYKIGSSWTLADEDGFYGSLSDPTNGLNVSFQNLEVPTYDNNSPRWREARMELQVGEVIA